MEKNISNISETSIDICIAFKEEVNRAFHGSRHGIITDYEKPIIPIGDYVTATHELLGMDNPLSETLLAERLEYLAQDSKLKLHFPENSRCCIAVIPFSPHGFRLPANEIENGNYLRHLIVSSRGKTEGFGIAESYIYKLFPKEIQNRCTFEVGNYEISIDQDPEFMNVTPHDRQMIMDAYKKTYREAQKIFNAVQ